MATKEQLKKALEASWSKDTCYEGHQSIWNAEKPSLGQCFVTTLVINDYLGGEIMKAKTNDGISHYWNVIDGEEFDLTRDQFEPGTEMINPHRVDRGSLEENERYRILKQNVEDNIRT